MARKNRIHIPGLSLHVIHRGVNHTAIFGDDADRELFLAHLEAAMARFAVAIHVFVLMSTHYHLIVTPESASALPNAMRQLGMRYVRYYNRKYDRIGTLWTGRYTGLFIWDELYWLTCVRYIEMNPVRAQMVTRPEDYRWSSYHAHALGERVPWLTEHTVYTGLGSTDDERRTAYRALCGQPLTEAELVRQRLGTQSPEPLRPYSVLTATPP